MLSHFIKRGVAFVMDAFILILIFYGNYQFVMASVGADVSKQLSLYALIAVLVLQIVYVLIYFIYIPVRLYGQTIGKKIVKLKEMNDNQTELDIKAYFKRDVMLKFLLISITGGLVMILNIILLCYQAIRRQELRAIHDIILKTKVVSVNQN